MLDLKRYTDWPDRLIAVIEEHRAEQFAWGRYDCATLFADVVDRITGFDPFASYWPYSSERQAAEKLVKSGYRDIQHLVSSLFPPVDPAHAQRGDVGFAVTTHKLCCPAIVTGTNAVSRDEAGWMSFPISELVTAYRIG